MKPTAILLLTAALASPLPAKEAAAIDAETLREWSAPYRGWHYPPDHVIPAKPEIEGFEDVKMTDVPTVLASLHRAASNIRSARHRNKTWTAISGGFSVLLHFAMPG